MTRDWIKSQLIDIAKANGATQNQAESIANPLATKWEHSQIKGTDKLFKEAIKQAKKLSKAKK